MMKTLVIVMLIACLSPPAIWAFSGSSTNYNLHYGIDGVGLAEGSSTNYSIISNLLFQPIGQFQSTNYALCLGPYCIGGVAEDVCTISVSPQSEQVAIGGTIQFTATETGQCNTPCYGWQVTVQGSSGSNVDSSGLYTAGTTTGSDEVTVTDPCNGNISDTADVQVVDENCDCEGNFDDDEDCDGTDAAVFKVDFGRSYYKDPCTNSIPCNGDFDCDVDVDGTDASLFKADFGRSYYKDPCPDCPTDPWCDYPE